MIATRTAVLVALRARPSTVAELQAATGLDRRLVSDAICAGWDFEIDGTPSIDGYVYRLREVA